LAADYFSRCGSFDERVYSGLIFRSSFRRFSPRQTCALCAFQRERAHQEGEGCESLASVFKDGFFMIIRSFRSNDRLEGVLFSKAFLKIDYFGKSIKTCSAAARGHFICFMFLFFFSFFCPCKFTFFEYTIFLGHRPGTLFSSGFQIFEKKQFH